MMTAISSLKYLLVLIFGISGAWNISIHRLSLGLGGIGAALGLLLAAVVFERAEREPAAEPESAPDPDLRATGRRRALIVGAGKVGRTIATQIEANGHYEVVGFIDDDLQYVEQGHWPVLGGREATVHIVREYGIDEVVLAYAPTWQQRLAEELVTTQPDVQIRLVPSTYEALMQISAVQSLGDIAIVRLMTDTRRRSDRIKRLLDMSASLCILVLFAPLMLLLALLIKATSRGPVIFAQERVGRFGRPFTLYKFRTMVADAESATGPVLSTGKADSRTTRIGRWLRLFRLDELPQLWNVLRGEMSLVGPRPERPCFVAEFECTIPAYARRHQVRPGITGLAQVLGGYHTDARDKLRFDLTYVSHGSFRMDLDILLRTVLVVVLPDRG
jgi:exopolysaccharide biosynthesis polyprenyl glycosylphosphotransferase